MRPWRTILLGGGTGCRLPLVYRLLPLLPARWHIRRRRHVQPRLRRLSRRCRQLLVPAACCKSLISTLDAGPGAPLPSNAGFIAAACIFGLRLRGGCAAIRMARGMTQLLRGDAIGGVGGGEGGGGCVGAVQVVRKVHRQRLNHVLGQPVPGTELRRGGLKHTRPVFECRKAVLPSAGF